MTKLVKLTGKITAIKAVKNPRIQRSNIYLDGKFAFSLDNEVIVKEALKPGREISPDESKMLTGADSFQRCLNAAFRFLSYRPRSESETRERLGRLGYEDQYIDQVVAKLKRLELVNDTAFAEFWKENRSSFRPKGQWLIKLELRRKGVESEVIKEVVGDIDETDNAYRAAMQKARTLPVADYQVFRQRLGSYLQRRGFTFGVINNIVKQAWQEKTQNLVVDPEVSEDIDALD